MPHHSPVRALHHVRREQLPRFAPLPRLIPRRKLHARDVPSRRRHPPLRASVPRPARERPRPLPRRRELVHLRRQPSPRDDVARRLHRPAREYPRDRARQRRFLRDAQDSHRLSAFAPPSAPRRRVVSRRPRRAARRARRVVSALAASSASRCVARASRASVVARGSARRSTIADPCAHRRHAGVSRRRVAGDASRDRDVARRSTRTVAVATSPRRRRVATRDARDARRARRRDETTRETTRWRGCR